MGDIVMSAALSQTSSGSHTTSGIYLYLHSQSSRVKPHSHISLPSLAVDSFALYAAELTSLRVPHCFLSSARLRLNALALGESFVATTNLGEQTAAEQDDRFLSEISSWLRLRLRLPRSLSLSERFKMSGAQGDESQGGCRLSGSGFFSRYLAAYYGLTHTPLSGSTLSVWYT